MKMSTTPDITPEEVAELRRRLAEYTMDHRHTLGCGWFAQRACNCGLSRRDKSLKEDARSLLPRLLDTLEHQAAEIERLRVDAERWKYIESIAVLHDRGDMEENIYWHVELYACDSGENPPSFTAAIDALRGEKP